MSRWREFLDSLDTTGGHLVLIMCALLVIGVAAHFGSKEASALLVGAWDVFLYAMRGRGNDTTKG